MNNDTGTPIQTGRKQACVNCGRCVRLVEDGEIRCHCELDNHLIGYVECFTSWCRRWKSEKRAKQ